MFHVKHFEIICDSMVIRVKKSLRILKQYDPGLRRLFSGGSTDIHIFCVCDSESTRMCSINIRCIH